MSISRSVVTRVGSARLYNFPEGTLERFSVIILRKFHNDQPGLSIIQHPRFSQKNRQLPRKNHILLLIIPICNHLPSATAQSTSQKRRTCPSFTFGTKNTHYRKRPIRYEITMRGFYFPHDDSVTIISYFRKRSEITDVRG